MVGEAISNYHLIGKIGNGGMGEVYRARDDRLDRDVAPKILPLVLSRKIARNASAKKPFY